METLASKIRSGDIAAFDQFYNVTYPRVMAYLSRVLYYNSLADDIAQETYIKLWVGRKKIDVSRSVDSYLFAILRNTITDHLRKLAADRKRLLSSASISIFNEAIDMKMQAADNVTDTLYYKEFASIYNGFLNQVSPVKQRCFRLHREQGLTYREIAVLEGLHIKKVERYISDTIQFLREKLLLFISTAIALSVLYPPLP